MVKKMMGIMIKMLLLSLVLSVVGNFIKLIKNIAIMLKIKKASSTCLESEKWLYK